MASFGGDKRQAGAWPRRPAFFPVDAALFVLGFLPFRRRRALALKIALCVGSCLSLLLLLAVSV
jgi:hypothetical protein